MKNKLVIILIAVSLICVSSISRAQSIGVCIGGITTPIISPLIALFPGGVWSSTNAAVASVGSTGDMLAVSGGTAVISYTYAGILGTLLLTVTVDVLGPPDPGVISGGNTVCAANSVALTETVAGGIWTASNSKATVGSASGVVTGVSAGASVISYAVSNVCGTTYATYPVTVNTTSSAGTISGATTVCTGSATTLSETTPGGTWTSSTASATIGSASGVVTGVSAGASVISYAVSNVCGTTYATYPVTVNTTSSAGTISGATTVCTGSATTLSETTPGGTWTSSTASATIGSASGLVTGVSVGSSVISYAVSNVCGTTYATYPVTVNTTPSAGTISGATTVCTGSATTLSETAPGGTWTSSTASATIGSASGLVTGVSAGTLVISYAVSNVCGTTYATYPVTVNTTSSAGTISGGATVCTGSATTLIETAPGGTWTSSTASATIGSASGLFTGVSAGASVISYAVSNVCGTSYATYPVTVNPLPDPGLVSGAALVCNGGTTNLGASVGGGLWSAVGSNVAIGSTSGLVSGLSLGAATISYTISNSCGAASATYSITVNTVPAAGLLSGAATVCAGATTTLGATVGGGLWSVVGAAAGIGSASGVVSGLSAGTVTVSYAVSNTCGSGYATYSVTVNPLATAGSLSGAARVCTGSSSTFTSSVGSGIWTVANANASVGSTSGIVTGMAVGTDVISYGVTNGCGTVYATYTVTVAAAPSSAGTIGGASSLCAGSPVTMSQTVSGGVWSRAYGYVDIGSASGVVTARSVGTDVLTYTVSNTCGSLYTTAAITADGTMGNIYTIAGSGAAGTATSGNDSNALLAGIAPRDLAVDSAGNLYFCDPAHNVIRRITRTGVITTIAGTGVAGNSGDGGPATAATLNAANGLYADRTGNTLLITNTNGHNVRRLDLSSGIITNIAGVPGSASASSVAVADGGPATNGRFFNPIGVCMDAMHNIYVADQADFPVRKIDAATGIISTIVGYGSNYYDGDNGPGTAARVGYVRDVAADNAGNLYIADATNQVVRKYVISTGIITTIAGTGVAGNTGDNGPATAAKLNTPARLEYDGVNTLYIVDQGNQKVRQVNLSTGYISTVAAVGSSGFSGDNGPATDAQLSVPSGIAVDATGNLYISDANNRRIREVIAAASLAITGPSSVCIDSSATYIDALGAGTWVSGAPSVASIGSASGVLTGLTAGTAVISFTALHECNAIAVVTVTVLSCGHRAAPAAGVSSFSPGYDLSLAPNPSSGTLALSGSLAGAAAQVSVDVVDLSGRVVHQQQLPVTNGHINGLITLGPSIAPGVYMLRVRNEGVSEVLRFVLSR